MYMETKTDMQLHDIIFRRNLTDFFQNRFQDSVDNYFISA